MHVERFEKKNTALKIQTNRRRSDLRHSDRGGPEKRIEIRTEPGSQTEGNVKVMVLKVGL